MRGFLRAFAAAAVLAATAVSASAKASNPGTTALPILKTPMGPRPIGMGGAFAAMDGDLYSAWHNPAGLGSLRKLDLAATFTKGLEDSGMQHLVVGFPLPWGLLTEDHPAVVSFGGLFTQNGKIEVNKLAADGSLLSSQSLSAGRDIVATFSVAQRAFDELHRSGGKTYVREHHFGFTAKYIRSTLAETYTADAWAFDGGWFFRLPEWGLGLGASVLNLGPGVKYISERDPLPTSYRGAVSLTKPFLVRDSEISMALDAEHFDREGQTKILTGVEYIHERFFAMRTGWRFGEDGSGLTLGFGFKRAGFTLDYAWLGNSVLSDSHRISLKLSLDVPWKLDMGPRKLRWEQVLEAPERGELEKKPFRREEQPEDEDLVPILPGWMR